MKTKKINSWQNNYFFIESEFNNIVRGDNNTYNFNIYDKFGNKTKYFSINSEQLEKIRKVLIEIK